MTVTRPEVVLGFDFGTRRIGVACGNTLTRTARPVKTLVHGVDPPWSEIVALVDELSPARFVVGVPYNVDGSETSLAPIVRDFARQLGERFGRPVSLIDERLSSHAAEAELRAARAGGALRKRLTHADVDMTAAKVLVEQWLRHDEQRVAVPDDSSK